MKAVLREEESGVSEVVGTILILAMTVVLFSTIIIWVSNIPTPVAQSRVDIVASLTPRYVLQGGLQVEQGDWINMTHQGGEPMLASATAIYITDTKAGGATNTFVVHLARWRVVNGTLSYGMLDGTGASWDVGQRFSYLSQSLSSSDQITVTVVDLNRSIVLWTSTLNPPAGTRPPIFLNVWAARNNVGTPLDVQTNTAFYVFAQIMDPDGAQDLNRNSVNGTLTYYYGSPSCSQPIQMFDDGPSGNHGDAIANDGVFTLFTNSCTGNAVTGMDGSLVLFSVKDLESHVSTTRMVLRVVPGSGGSQGGGGYGGSGRPPNLRWNGNQGYNIFNASQWDTYGYAALPTRTFRGNETVVLVVGSLSLQNVFGVNQFMLLDPYSGNPAEAVVYGASKTVASASIPSTTSAFSFFQFVNGYYIYTYRFKLNDASVGTNFYTAPPQYPRYYYYASYPLSVLVTDSMNDRFTTTDSINITSAAGGLRLFPAIKTFKDAGYTQPASTFNSTAIVYVQVNMLTANANGSAGEGNGQVLFGNILIQDFAGGQELNRAPTNGIYSNLPVCPPKGSCSSSAIAIWADAGTVSYRFAINLARVNQDPWVAGTQNYGLTIASIKDSDESYASVSIQIQVRAPVYKMDLAMGADQGSNPAWSGHNYALFYQDYNGFDAWKSLLVDTCGAGGQSTSGLSGGGNGKCPTASNVKLAFGDFWHDGTLGLAESIVAGSNAVVLYRKTIDATGAVVYLPVFFDMSPPSTCTAIAAGDVTGNGLPSLICGGANGWVWYYANNGNWTRTYVDQPTGQQINSVTVGDFNGDGWNDIAVGGNTGYLKYYPNLGFGRFQNTGINDNWFAGAEQTVMGNITSGTYLSTYVQDGIYEQPTEVLLNLPLQTGSTANPGFNNTAANWTFANAYNGATGSAQASGGNPGAFAQITDPRVASATVAGYWYQPFTISGSSPFTATLSLNYEITVNNAANGVTMYAFVNATCGKPPQSPTSSAWSSGSITGTRGWTTASVSVGQLLTTAPMSTVTTYCLEVAMYARYGATGSGNSVGGFDNVLLSWSSTPGSTSALEQYWRIGPLPTRPGTAFTFNLYGHESGGPPEYDNFTIAYATNVVGDDPTTGIYTTMRTVAGSSDTSYTYALPAGVAGMTVWIRALDTNRLVTATPTLDSLYVDRMWINANTPSGTTGVTLTADGSTVNMVNAQDANGDGYYDLVAGTQNANIYKYTGGTGGLTSNGLWYGAGSGNAIVGVKWGNFTTSFPGLEIALAFGTTVRIIRGDVANTVIQSSLPAFSPSATITAFAVGDINGDGWDDVAIGTTGSSGAIFLWENLGQGTSWTYAVTLDSVGSTVFSIVLGDSTNSQYMGR
jgi:flagellin-like protein